MNRFAIYDQNNVVTNIVIGTLPLGPNWEVCPEDVQVGWKYEGNGSWSSPAEPFSVFLSGLSVKANSVTTQYFAGNHYANVNDVVDITANLIDSVGNIQAQISFPLTLKLPLVRHADGKPTTDEIYMNFTLVNGAFSASTEIKSSGDWKVLIHRLNGALERMFNATKIPVDQRFIVKADDITIIV